MSIRQVFMRLLLVAVLIRYSLLIIISVVIGYVMGWNMIIVFFYVVILNLLRKGFMWVWGDEKGDGKG